MVLVRLDLILLDEHYKKTTYPEYFNPLHITSVVHRDLDKAVTDVWINEGKISRKCFVSGTLPEIVEKINTALNATSDTTVISSDLPSSAHK